MKAVYARAIMAAVHAGIMAAVYARAIMAAVYAGAIIGRPGVHEAQVPSVPPMGSLGPPQWDLVPASRADLGSQPF